MRNPAIPALLAVCLLLAGCSGGSGKTDDTDPGTAPPIEVTDTTGGIRGVVVDEAIVPLVGALVKLNNQQEATTDEQGGFGFSRLAPGDYFVSVTKPGYEPAQTTTTVVAGVEDPDLVRMLLVKIPGADPYFQTYKLDGFYECAFSASTPVLYITDGCDFAYRTAWDEYNNTQGSPPPGGLPRTVQQFSNTQFIDVGAQAWAIVQESFWDDSTVETFWQSVSSTPIDNSCDCSETDYMRMKGANPIYGRLDRFAEDGAEDGNFPDGLLVAVRGFLPAEFTDPAASTGGTALNFDFAIITNVFYNYLPAEGWNFVDNGQDPL